MLLYIFCSSVPTYNDASLPLAARPLALRRARFVGLGRPAGERTQSCQSDACGIREIDEGSQVFVRNRRATDHVVDHDEAQQLAQRAQRDDCRRRPRLPRFEQRSRKLGEMIGALEDGRSLVCGTPEHVREAVFRRADAHGFDLLVKRRGLVTVTLEGLQVTRPPFLCRRPSSCGFRVRSCSRCPADPPAAGIANQRAEPQRD